jgi:hypothetical protein
VWCPLVVVLAELFPAPCSAAVPAVDPCPPDLPPPPELRISTTATATTITAPRISSVTRPGDRPLRAGGTFASGRRVRESALKRSACLTAAAVPATVPAGALTWAAGGAGGREVEALRRGGTEPVPPVTPGGDAATADGGVGARGVAVAGLTARAAAAAVAGAPELGGGTAPGVAEAMVDCGEVGEEACPRTASQPSRGAAFPDWAAGVPCVTPLAGAAAPGAAGAAGGGVVAPGTAGVVPALGAAATPAGIATPPAGVGVDAVPAGVTGAITPGSAIAGAASAGAPDLP